MASLGQAYSIAAPGLAMPPRVPPFARAAFTGVVASGPDVAA